MSRTVNPTYSSSAHLPLTSPFVSRFPGGRESVFEPRSFDYDRRAPLEPPRDLTDLARLTAQRVVDRLETFENSPLVRQLRDDLDRTIDSHDITREMVDDQARQHDEVLERLERLEHRWEVHNARVVSTSQADQLRLESLESRLRLTEACLLVSSLTATGLLALWLSLKN